MTLVDRALDQVGQLAFVAALIDWRALQVVENAVVEQDVARALALVERAARPLDQAEDASL